MWLNSFLYALVTSDTLKMVKCIAHSQSKLQWKILMGYKIASLYIFQSHTQFKTNYDYKIIYETMHCTKYFWTSGNSYNYSGRNIFKKHNYSGFLKYAVTHMAKLGVKWYKSITLCGYCRYAFTSGCSLWCKLYLKLLTVTQLIKN